MRDVTKFYIVYDIKTPIGYIPFFYNKKNIGCFIEKSLKGTLDIKDKYKLHKKILTSELTYDMLHDNSITLLVAVKKPKNLIDGVDIKNVISEKLKNYMEVFDNFKVIYT